MNYSDYQTIVKEDIFQTIETMGCQPILFIGSGLSRRYCNIPNWMELLQYLSENCQHNNKGINYYRQICSSLDEIGSILAKIYAEWAWESGKDRFPQEFFTDDYPYSIYIKYSISQFLMKLCREFNIETSPFNEEIKKLREIRPHAVITTNYDSMLETIFPQYTPIIGQKIIRANFVSYGEIYKIHGCCTNPKSIIFTHEDYENFISNKKYLSAKLLTYFAEHPLLFIGYSITDRNIAGILSDIDEILSQGDDVIPNIYFLEWKSVINNKFEKFESIIQTEKKQIRVKNIVADNFSWVFEAFNSGEITTSVDPKMLRKLIANTYRLVRHDFPRRNFQVDYQILESACNSTDGLAKLFGVTVLDSPEQISAQYPYILTQLAYKLDYTHWTYAKKLMQKIENENNVKFQNSDNQYHINIKTGTQSTSSIHKYSVKMLELLKLVKNGQPYELEQFSS